MQKLLLALVVVSGIGLGLYVYSQRSTTVVVTTPTPIATSTTEIPVPVATHADRITWVDSGRVFVFAPGSRFTVVLDSTRYEAGKLSCSPATVLRELPVATAAKEGEFVQSFETGQSGECWLTDGDFSIKIRIVADTAKKEIFNAPQGYSFMLPVTVTKTQGSDGDMYADKPLARFELARNDESANTTGTNLGEAAVLVGTASSKEKVAACLTPHDTEEALGQRTLNGIPFSVFKSLGAAAGNRYVVTSMRTVHAGMCWEVAEFVHYGVIGNYDPGVALDFDAAAVAARLDSVASTFAF